MRAASCSRPGRPEVDAVYGIPPTVAIEQRLSRGGRKSTVATTTEVWHFLRLLYVKLGIQHCINDGAPVQPQSADSIAAQLLRELQGPARRPARAAGRATARASTPTSPSGRGRAATRTCASTASSCRSTGARASTASRSTRIELPVGDLDRRAGATRPSCATLLATALEHGKGVMHVLSAAGRPARRDAGRRADRRHRRGARCSRPSAPARSAAPATPSSTRACSATTASTAGAPTASAPASS